jgi:asparagine synthetase B (glutamine-hydrolysing)
MNAGLTSQNLRKGDAAFHSSRASALSSVTSGAAIHRVACLLSGGVDSSVALALLCNQEVRRFVTILLL